MIISGIQQIGVGVSDPDAAFKWYSTRLGSENVENITGECFRKCAITKISRASYVMEDAKRLWDVSLGYVKGYL